MDTDFCTKYYAIVEQQKVHFSTNFYWNIFDLYKSHGYFYVYPVVYQVLEFVGISLTFKKVRETTQLAKGGNK